MDLENACNMLRGFPGLSDCFVMPPTSRKTDRSQLFNLTSLVGTGHGLVMVTFLLPASFGSRGGLAGLQEIAALDDRRAALPPVSDALQHASYVENVACIGLDAHQVQRQADKIAEISRAAGLSGIPVTKASSKDEFVELSFDGVCGRVSVQSLRSWMRKLAIEEALRHSALSGASLRRLVGHLSHAFLMRRPCLSTLSSVVAF